QRTAKIIPCKHTFHLTCMLKWKRKKSQKPCCICRGKLGNALDEQNNNVNVSFPFELRKELWMRKGNLTSKSDVAQLLLNDAMTNFEFSSQN
ncbi:hypothetical protein PMAYCL1PPCAC_10392, partial [Pristionchus mayeri]